MSKKFSEDTLNAVQEKLSQAESVAIGASTAKGPPSEQFIMFIYEKLLQEDFVVNNTLKAFVPNKPAEIHVLPGRKNENKLEG